jgi:ABC-type amino acid transport substrate-binding protein
MGKKRKFDIRKTVCYGKDNSFSKEAGMSKNTFHVKKAIVGLLLILGLLGIAWQSGCRKQSRETTKKEPGKLDRIKNAGRIIVGTSADYPPYEFRLLAEMEESFAGIDIDIAKAIAADLNVKLEIKNIVFHKLFDELAADHIDLILAGLAPTQDRQKIIDFSIPYYQAIQNMLIRSKDKEKIKLLEDLRGKNVGTQTGSIQEDMARTMIYGAVFTTQPTIQKLIDELASGKLDAVILEKPWPMPMCSKTRTS